MWCMPALEYFVKRLQIIFNTSARMVVGCTRFNPVSGYICDVFHWLPAAQRIDFKVATVAFKALMDMLHRT